MVLTSHFFLHFCYVPADFNWICGNCAILGNDVNICSQGLEGMCGVGFVFSPILRFFTLFFVFFIDFVFFSHCVCVFS